MWCWTLNNPSPGDLDMLTAHPQLQYLVYQRERGENGTEHFQGYLQLKKKLRMSALKKMNSRIHWEISRGTPTQARNYCMKEDTRVGEIVELGEFQENSQGARTDLYEVQAAFDAGATKQDYAENFFPTFTRYPNLLNLYAAAKVRPRTGKEKIVCHFYYGLADSGKTRLAHLVARLWGLRAPAHGYRPGYYCFDLKRWFDGYLGERVVILDDFSGSGCSFRTFKLLIDRYPFQMGVKGSSCTVAATHFIITSNFLPHEWWKQEVTGSDLSAIYRRITHVKYFPEPGKVISFSSYREFGRLFDTAQTVDGKERQERLEQAQTLEWEALEAEVDEEEDRTKRNTEDEEI